MSIISIIIPAYNEQENISGVIKEIKETLNIDYEILLIDDASGDKTPVLAKAQGARVIRHPYHMGNGACVKSGIRNAKGEILVFMDGDGQHNPQDIPKLLEHIEQYDMVIGAREKNSSVSFHRRLANKIYNLFASYVTRFKIKDLTSGFRAVKKDTAKNFTYLLPNTFSYPATITLAFLKTGRSIKYVPIKTGPRKGKSKIKLISHGSYFFLVILKIAILFSPLRIFFPVSLFFLLLGILYYGYTFIAFHRFTNMSALLITTSIIIFMLGLISEQISMLRMERTEKNISSV